MTESFTLLLVHSPLVGPMTCELTAASLRGKGASVVVPSLVAVTDGDPPYYEKFAAVAAELVAGNSGPVVLVGHSGAGSLLPVIAETVGDNVRGAVFVDAVLPHPGRSWFDTVPLPMREMVSGLVRAGRLPPWNEWFPSDVVGSLVSDPALREQFIGELPRLPVEYFAEPAPDAHLPSVAGCAYVRLSEAYDQAADEAQQQGWWVRREDADHLAMLTRPDRMAEVIGDVVAAAAGW